jgi:Fe-S-cluster-containing dehydrogenase component
MTVERRAVLRVLAGTGLAATGAVPTLARERVDAPPDAIGLLYDATRCIGCKACVVACREANGLQPDTRYDGIHEAPLDLSSRAKSVIKLYKEGSQISFVKAQCMQCLDPACASACMIQALKKDAKTGVVAYDATYCVGCRYCQIACPYGVPRFEFEKAVPKIVKCELCRHRFPADGALQEVDGFSRFPRGQGPACSEVCPRGAVIYGKRTELLAEARRRLAQSPEQYVPKVYGERDGGGTQALYLSHVPFEKLGLPSLGDESVSETMRTVQHGIYRGFVAPVALYAALGAVMLRNRRAGQRSSTEGKEERP